VGWEPPQPELAPIKPAAAISNTTERNSTDRLNLNSLKVNEQALRLVRAGLLA
jgi:hypothetical protein